jgi:trehalose-phosphatase
LEYFFDQWEVISQRIKKENILLMLDYDGTLTPIQARPEEAKLSKEMRGLLSKLGEKMHLAIISGRSLEEIKELVKIKKIFYAGNHGLEIEGGEEKFVYPQALETIPIIKGISEQLKKALIKGIQVEDKKFAVSFHYRGVNSSDVKKAKSFFNRVVSLWIKEKTIGVSKGKKILELRPTDWDKGKALGWIWDRLGKELFPIYIGDDLTDEDAFATLGDKGISILVTRRKKRSFAKYYLRKVEEVEKFLESLLNLF